MKYTLLLHSDETRMKDAQPEDMAAMQAAYQAYIGELVGAGVFEATDYLLPTATGVNVSMKTGERIVQDGPYVDSKEQIGGYFVINVDTIEDAVNWAAKCPAAQYGGVDVRATALPSE